MVSRFILAMACLGLAAGGLRCRSMMMSQKPNHDPDRSDECSVCIASAIKIDNEITRMRQQGLKDMYSPFACPLMKEVNQSVCQDILERVQLSDSLGVFDPKRVCTKSNYCPSRGKNATQNARPNERGDVPAGPWGAQPSEGGHGKRRHYPVDIVFCQKHKKVH